MKLGPDNAGRAAYAFAVLGSCALELQAQAIAAMTLLQRQQPRFPLVAMLSASCFAAVRLHAVLSEMDVRPHTVPAELSEAWSVRHRCVGKADITLRLPPHKTSSHSYRAMYDKLSVWNLTDYKALLFLDSDLAVLRPLDHVLEEMVARPEVGQAIAQDGCYPISPSSRGLNLGVWGVRPSALLFRSLFNLVKVARLPCDNTPVQSVARKFFRFNVRQRKRFAPFEYIYLDQGHNMQVNTHPRSGATSVSDCRRKLNLSEEQLRVIHWTGNTRKPAYGMRAISDPLEAHAFAEYRAAYCAAVNRLRGVDEPLPLGSESCSTR